MVAITIFSIASSSWFSSQSGYGCVASSGNSSFWTTNTSPDLIEKIKEAHAKGGMVYSVSVASNGDWFFSSSAFNTRKVFDDVSKSRVTKFCQLASARGIPTQIGNISWITFMPGAEGYIGSTVVDGTEYCFYEGVPQSLETKMSSSTSKTVRSVSVGYNDSWIVVYKDGSSSWNGIADALAEKLQAGYICDVESVMLSPKTLNDFIINYEDGASYYVLPPAWGPSIAKEEQLLIELTMRLQQTMAMNSAAGYSASVMNNAVANTSNMAAASAMAWGAGLQALSLEAAMATQASGNF